MAKVTTWEGTNDPDCGGNNLINNFNILRSKIKAGDDSVIFTDAAKGDKFDINGTTYTISGKTLK